MFALIQSFISWLFRPASVANEQVDHSIVAKPAQIASPAIAIEGVPQKPASGPTPKPKPSKKPGKRPSNPLDLQLAMLLKRLRRRVRAGEPLRESPRRLKSEFLECLQEQQDRILREHWPSTRNRISLDGGHRRIPKRIWFWILRREERSELDTDAPSPVPSYRKVIQKMRNMFRQLLG